ncbi:MAG: hypothetical protein K2I23_04205, partial [Clostridia bacterium]|nr:hypothetical protein [Clostridia bacterium]
TVTSTSATATSGVLGGSLAVRPALHLNLSSAALSAATLLDDPSDVTDPIYTGNPITFNSTFTSATNTPSWYTTAFATAVANSKISVKYKDKDGTQISIPTDARDDYKIEFEINDSTGKTKWANFATNSATTREIKYKINPKPIRYTVDQTGGSTTLPTVTHNAADLASVESSAAQGTILGFKFDTPPGAFPEYHDTKAPTVNGTYTATVVAINTNYTPSPLSSPKSVTYVAQGAILDVPKTTEASEEYTASPIIFMLDSNFDDDKMEIVKSSLPSGVTYDDTAFTLSATKAGKYKVQVALKKKDNSMFWAGTRDDVTDKYIEFEITPAKIKVNLDNIDSSKIIKAEENGKVTLEGTIMGMPLGTDSVNLQFAAKTGNREIDLKFNKDGDTVDMTKLPAVYLDLINIELHTTGLSKMTYDLILKSDNDNYEFDVTPSGVQLTVEAKVVTMATWRLVRNGAGIDTVTATLGDTTPITYSKTLTYSDRYTYSFQMIPLGLKLDTTYGTGGYQVDPQDLSNSKIGKNADTYTTSVRLLDKDNNPTIYTIEWTIDPVKFNLAGIKWLYDDGSALQLPYDKVNGSEAKLDSKTLPKGLTPTY